MLLFIAVHACVSRTHDHSSKHTEKFALSFLTVACIFPYTIKIRSGSNQPIKKRKNSSCSNLTDSRVAAIKGKVQSSFNHLHFWKRNYQQYKTNLVQSLNVTHTDTYAFAELCITRILHLYRMQKELWYNCITSYDDSPKNPVAFITEQLHWDVYTLK